MIDFTIYSTTTGEILRVGSCSEADYEHQTTSSAEGIVADHYQHSEWYVDILTTFPVRRPSMDIKLSSKEIPADGITSIQVTGIPLGSIVTLNGINQIAYKTTAQLIFDIEGSYLFSVTLFPYTTFEETINAI